MGSVGAWTANVLADVCVVGAGPAGLTVTRELAARGVAVCLLEAGGEDVDRRTQRQSRGESDGYPIHRLDHSRVRAVGGTLRHHRVAEQGWMSRPLDPIDFEARDWLPESGWPFDRAHLEPYYERAAALCGIPVYDDDLQEFRRRLPAGIGALQGEELETTVFRQPTLALVEGRRDLTASPLVQLMPRTRVVDLTTDGTGRRVDGVVAVGADGRRLLVRARAVVLATGGIENARLLLLADGGAGIGNEHDLVGRYFAERMLFPAGVLLLSPEARAAADALGPVDGLIGALRLREEVQRDLGLHNCTLHVASRLDVMASASGQSISTLRKAWGRRPLLPHLGSHVGNAVAAVGQAPGLARRALGRGRRTLVVGHMGEQAPNPESRVRLGTGRDDLGMPVARVTWQMTEADGRAAEASVRVLDRAVRASGAGHLEWTARLDSTTLVTGAHHHLGTTRMHADPRQGVVDPDSRVHSMDNLYVAGSSVFPTYG
ncbi:MAG TPA: GMC family oxidoreductase, partial [Phycicoccus sp.]|nr:GMC family oxidoreductase [Phycicoccus sp.]